ncbi:hypothetical protein DL96DRAFT_1676657 [Flagelloscypha sp. PMI_526]|nr:hypothetical protein DL96DRAFT_1676657 [Flagelloscypha sp. PMI_526]
MRFFSTLLVSASILAGLVAATPAPSLSGLLVPRQSFTIPSSVIPDQCKSACTPMVNGLNKCGTDNKCACAVDINSCFDCLAGLDSSVKTVVDNAKSQRDDICKAVGVSTSSSSSNAAMQFSAKGSAGVMAAVGVVALVAL